MIYFANYCVLWLAKCHIFVRLETMHPNVDEGFSYCMFRLFVCFVALRPKSTAMVMAGRSVHLTTLFPGQA